MTYIYTPTIETTKDFILIKIPRRMVSRNVTRGKLSDLERGLKKSLEEESQGKLFGPFSNAGDFLHALKKPSR